MRYRVTKTYGADVGLSCCFRQWRAPSHCGQLHGYALAFSFTFGADCLDERGWVLDFGGLAALRRALEAWYDHTLVYAADDPDANDLRQLGINGIASVRVLSDGVGCERFAQHAAELAQRLLDVNASLAGRVKLISVTCAEHGANSATYYAL